MAAVNDSVLLRIYVARHCLTCAEALRLAEEVSRQFNRVKVEVIDLDIEDSKNLDDVFSVPTYVLNGRTLSLGNPDRDKLFSTLKKLGNNDPVKPI